MTLIAAALLGSTAMATDITVPFTGERPHTLELHAGFAYYSVGLAAGGRYGIPIVDNGFIGPLNNSIYINFGLDFYLISRIPGFQTGGGVGFGVPVAMQWNFYFTDDWSAYAEVGVNAYFDSYTFEGNGLYFGGPWIIGSIGGRYHFADNLALVGRLGSPYASIGIEFSL